ncbi:MAG: aspartyl protease family protein [Thermoguttaceae bacterium]|jgi:clan AA aspartic protease
MESKTTGRVLAEATIANLEDLWAARQNRLPPEGVRCIVVKDALVDTGARMLALPSRLIRELGLNRVETRRVTTSAGQRQAAVYEVVRLTIQGRSCVMDVMEVPDDVPVLIGQIPLERLDFVVDPGSCSLVGNPAHGGEYVIEAY